MSETNAASEDRVFVFSIALGGYARIFKSCVDSQKSYADSNGYSYRLISRSPRDLSPSESAWLKILLLDAALSSSFEWVAFIDADCEIRAHAPPFDEALPQKYSTPSDGVAYMANGFSGRLNSGTIFVKNGECARLYFRKLLMHANRRIPKQDRAPYENGHIIHYSHGNPCISRIDWRLWNNNRCIDESSYIQHYSGGPLRDLYLSKVGETSPASSKSVYVAPQPVVRVMQPFKDSVSRFAKVWQRLVQPPLSSRLAQLLPFYEENVDVFSRSRF